MKQGDESKSLAATGVGTKYTIIMHWLGVYGILCLKPSQFCSLSSGFNIVILKLMKQGEESKSLAATGVGTKCFQGHSVSDSFVMCEVYTLIVHWGV